MELIYSNMRCIFESTRLPTAGAHVSLRQKVSLNSRTSNLEFDGSYLSPDPPNHLSADQILR